MARGARKAASYGTGRAEVNDLGTSGDHVVLEDGCRLFHPESIHLADNVYVGHDTILNGYHDGSIRVGTNTWIGPQCFWHGAGGITVGANVGIGAGVKIITSTHQDEGRDVPLLHGDIVRAPVVIGDDCDIGVGTVILPGVTIGRGALIGAGAVVSEDVEAYAVAAGVPARKLRSR